MADFQKRTAPGSKGSRCGIKKPAQFITGLLVGLGGGFVP